MVIVTEYGGARKKGKSGLWQAKPWGREDRWQYGVFIVYRWNNRYVRILEL